MKKEKICTWAFALVSSLFLSGCGPDVINPDVIKLYSGPELPDDQIATLSASEADVFWQNLRVDGQPVNPPNSSRIGDYYDEYIQIKLAPGLHEIQWTRPARYEGNWTFKVNGTLDAKPGHIYDTYFCFLPVDPNRLAPYYVILGSVRIPVADYTAWTQDRNSGEVVLGAKALGGSPKITLLLLRTGLYWGTHK